MELSALLFPVHYILLRNAFLFESAAGRSSPPIRFKLLLSNSFLYGSKIKMIVSRISCADSILTQDGMIPTCLVTPILTVRSKMLQLNSAAETVV